MPVRRKLFTCMLGVGFLFASASAIPAPNKSGAAPDRPLRVAFLNPASTAPDEVWWRTCTDFMQAAANDFGMKLRVYHAGRSAAEMYRQAQEVLNGDDKPDFIVMQNMKKTAPDIIKQASAHGVKVFLFNSALSAEEVRDMGIPREKYANWIGQMTPDDEGAGFDLAALLVRAAKKAGQIGRDGKVEMLALGGTVSDTSAIERNKGLQRYVNGHANEVILNRERPLAADWETERAKVTFAAAYPAYPNTTAVWNANDNMAIGTLQAATKGLGKKPGKDLFIGGIDWNPENLAAVKSGTITASIGGHFMEGAWVMVLLHDYARGVDFAPSGLMMKSKMGVISKTNVDKFEKSLGDRSFERIDRIDFTQFSKVGNPKLKAYPFSLGAILDQLK